MSTNVRGVVWMVVIGPPLDSAHALRAIHCACEGCGMDGGDCPPLDSAH